MAEGAAAGSAATASIAAGSEEPSCSSNNSQLCFQWHHHQKSVVELLDQLWEKQELVDVTLAADGQFIRVHKIVLCASSDYFQDILTDKDHEDKHAIVILKDVEFADLQALVHYLYKGEVRINENQLSSFINTAKSLGIRGLMREEEAKAKEVGQRKRQKSDSEGESCDEDSYSSDEGLSIASSVPPPPPPLKHKTSLSKSMLDVKKEVQNTASEMHQQSHNTTLMPQTPHYSHHSSYSHHHNSHQSHHQHQHHHPHHQVPSMESMKNASMTPNDINTNGLGIFPCPGDPGPSRSSEDDSNLQHQSGNEAGEWAHEIHNGTSSHHASTHHPHAPHVHPSEQMSPSNGNGEDRYSCPRCGRGYKWKQTVTRHLRYECGVDPQFACPICNSLFRHKVVLMRHMKRHANLM